ncbi:zinc finger MYM-type protein 1-like [Hydra vulgaris]|uniref:Zinc finger MYM-type protein 1-like n=1 Tax=Hydra vulgaris TaxID=6087 RepID=A0ABM4BN13_HYDVU
MRPHEQKCRVNENFKFDRKIDLEMDEVILHDSNESEVSNSSAFHQSSDASDCDFDFPESNENQLPTHTKNFALISEIQNIISRHKSGYEKRKERQKRNEESFRDVILFLAECGFTFRGVTHLIGDSNNGNFLGLLELLSHYDPLLEEHLKNVKQTQIEKQRLQVHYLSPDIQNEFISCCADYLKTCILKERETMKYYSLIVDATPDSAHIEQTTFILRYVTIKSNKFKIMERFFAFVDCNKKTGEYIANLILETLQRYNIPISDYRAQGYDNGSNMSGSYKGAQVHILQINSLTVFSPRACYSLNLCGVHAAESCIHVVRFFGTIQKLYNIFSSSPQR